MTVLRADARRNLDRILEAAADAFAELGPDVTIDEIARRAGVGHGTVFRRFPTKDGLRAAVLRMRLEEILGRAKELLDEPDAGAAFEEFVWVAAASCRRDRFLFEGVEKCVFEEVATVKQELHEVGRPADPPRAPRRGDPPRDRLTRRRRARRRRDPGRAARRA